MFKLFKVVFWDCCCPLKTYCVRHGIMPSLELHVGQKDKQLPWYISAVGYF